MDIVVSNKASRPLYEQISTQIKAAIMSGELKTGEAIPSVRSLAKSLHISILTLCTTVQTADSPNSKFTIYKCIAVCQMICL